MKQLIPCVMGNYTSRLSSFFNSGNTRKSFLAILCAFLFIPALFAQSAPELKREWEKQISTSSINYIATVASAIGPDQMQVVVGFSRDAGGVSRIVVTKLNLTGDVVWQQEYAGPEGSISDDPYQLELDPQGNIYIFGSVAFEIDNPDLLVLKYTSDGAFAWVQHLNGGEGIRDLPERMVVSDAGEVYVTGTSQVVGGSKVLTAKINAGGDIAWVDSFEGPTENSDPQVQSIALDAAGDVYVAGNMVDPERGRTLYIAKYSQQNGQQLWVNLPYGGEVTNANNYTADKILFDKTGEIYIAGTRAAIATVNLRPLLVRLDNEGNHIWSKFDETTSYATYFTDAALDSQDNLVILYSSLLSRNSSEIYLVKYNAAGEKLWHDLIPSNGGELQLTNALALDNNDRIAFTGFVRDTRPIEDGDAETYLYNTSGERIGYDRYTLGDQGTATGSDLAFDESGDLYVAGRVLLSGSTPAKLLLIKYDTGNISPPPVGAELPRAWVASAAGMGEPKEVLFDSKNQPLVFTNNKLLVYNANGQKLWEKELTGTYKAAKVDDADNIYILSNQGSGVTQRTVVVTKLSSAGDEVWKYTTSAAQNRLGRDLEINNAQEVYVLSSTFTANETSSSVTLVKLNAAGSESWVSNHLNEEGLSATAIALELAENGDIYITGNALREPGTNYLFLSGHSGTDGSMLWSKRYPEEGNNASHYYPQELFLHSDGTLYVAGTTQSCCISHPTAFVVKADAEGNILWNTRAGDGSEISLFDASLGEDGSMAVVGSYYNPRAGVNTTFASRINSAGEQVWYELIERVLGVTALDNGKVAVTGTANSDLLVYVFDADGIRAQQDIYDSGEGREDRGLKLSVDKAGNLYAAGTAGVAGSQTTDLLLVKYGDNTTPEEPCNIPVNVKLYLPPMAKSIGWQVRTTADFGSYILNEDTGVRWTWGDGTEPTISYTAFGTQRITGEHTYKKAGIYTIGLDFEESCLDPTSDDFTQQMVIYDPQAGFVTGSGEFQAPAEYGNAKFTYNFRVQYPNKYATEPVGSLRIMVGEKEYMASRTLDWLVIDGNRAAMQGTASLAGVGNYKFVATMLDGGGPVQNDPTDGLRLQVWDMNAYGKLVFDSKSGGDAKLDLMQPLPTIGIGQIIINGAADELATKEPDSEKATAYPNPFVDRTTVTFTSMADGNYEALLYNGKGTVVATLKSGITKAAEEINIEVDGKALRNGLYFVKLSTGDKVQTVKLLLQR
ncbi:T9SS type A sorting domain-containing protein [Pontibacter sp. H249]|uniref:T9SS type A sorting domain-containing protein n=1 Tax=Pontibacter sp. H249 TaxID=3133420 RepID=UPI0030BC6B19